MARCNRRRRALAGARSAISRGNARTTTLPADSRSATQRATCQGDVAIPSMRTTPAFNGVRIWLSARSPRCRAKAST